MTLEWPKWLAMGSKRAHFTCLCTPNGLRSFLEKHIFDPCLTRALYVAAIGHIFQTFPKDSIRPRTAPKKGPQEHHKLCTLAADSPKPKTNHIMGYVAQNAISCTPNPPATTHLQWFPPLKNALTDP